ncbi:MAG: hypothetical protein NTW21_34780 [Verrucomicrobia bacterium]|nr:hypothetical protein [Verrucomicrobiota bacterium]
MKPTTLSSLMALALAGSAWATSPYDTAYGLQWNFMIGSSSPDCSSGAQTDVTSDGTVFVTNRTGVATWGDGASLGTAASGVGSISALGKLLYGTSLKQLPGMMSPDPNYLSGVSAVGNTAYIGINGEYNQHWAGQDTSDANRVMTFSLDSSGLSSIANQHRLTIYKNNAGAPRTDGLGPNLPNGGLETSSSQNRSVDSAVRDSTLDMIIVGDIIGDFGYADDYGTTGTYGAFIGCYNLTTNTLTGPEKQPVVYNALSAINRATYSRAGIDQSTGRYYGAGSPSTGGASIDPDGTGPLAPLALDVASSNGFVVAYDTSDSILYTVVWDSPTAGATTERISAIAPTNDGTNFVFFAGYTSGDMPGFIGTNANPGTRNDAYVELRDAAGAVVWSDQLAMSSLSDAITAAEVLANGDLMVTGYKDGTTAGIRDSFIRKYKKTGPTTYTVAWTRAMDNPLDPTNLINDQLMDAAFGPTGDAVHLTVSTSGQWNNTTGYTYLGGGDVLVQKLVPGDFNADGIVDFADVQIAGTATKPGLTGVDTYDFNADGDSTLADTTYMITNIMDRLVGDIAQDSLVTDVDNADIGRAIGASGVGTLYLDGDIDFDGDVDNADITAVAAAFTGAKTPGKWTNGTPDATLRYRASDGQVWIHANEATGGIITSFQLENAAGTFVPANYTSPTGGSFGGTLNDVTTNVIGDTDLTLAGSSGVSGLISLGTVFPTGLDLAGLTAYLKTAVYTGQPGSGQMQFTLVVGDITKPYDTWAGGPFLGTLSDNNPALDFDGGGLMTGIEWVCGGDPTNGSDDASVAPTFDNTSDPDFFIFIFRRSDAANTDPNTTISVQYGSNLTGWTTAVDNNDTIEIEETNDHFASGIDRVVVKIKRTLATDGKLFAQLKVIVSTP